MKNDPETYLLGVSYVISAYLMLKFVKFDVFDHMVAIFLENRCFLNLKFVLSGYMVPL